MPKNKKKTGSKKKKIIFSIIGVLVIAVVALAIFSGNKEKIISVNAETAQKRNITQVVSATGKIQSEHEVVITPEVTGEIMQLTVEEGEKVEKDQKLIQIKQDQYEARVKQAKATLEAAQSRLQIRKANLKQVESEYKRVKELYEKGLASDSQLEQAEANYLSSKGEYEAQKSSVTQNREGHKDALEELEKTSIHSPLNGTITKLNVDLGEKVLGSNFTQGTNIMTVSDLNNMEAIVEVDENDIVLIETGDTAKVEIDAFKDREFLGIVTHVGNSAMTTNAGSQNEVVNFEVKIKLIDKDKQIRPGMSCTADIETETVLDVVSVPIQSVTARVLPKKNGKKDNSGEASSVMRKRPEPEEVVFTVEEENRTKIVPVEIGISDDNFMQIKSGIEEGAKVVTGPYRAVSKELSDSSFVSVSENGKPQFAKNE